MGRKTATGEFQESAWRQLYSDALFEKDKSKTVQRIAAAEAEIIRRGRSLFRKAGVAGGFDRTDRFHPHRESVAEARALDSALDMLRALKSCYRMERQRSISIA